MSTSLALGEVVEMVRLGGGKTPGQRGTYLGSMGLGSGPVIAAGVMASAMLALGGTAFADLVTSPDGFESLSGDGASATSAPGSAAVGDDPGDGSTAPTHSPEPTGAGGAGDPATQTRAPGSDGAPGTADPASETSGSGSGTVSVELPDSDGNGVADALEQGEPTGSSGSGEDSGDASGSTTDPAQPGADDTGSSQTQGDDPVGSGGPADRPRASGPQGSAGVVDGVYVIQQGDTLSYISGSTGVPLDVLRNDNQIADPHLIYTGASLVLRSP